MNSLEKFISEIKKNCEVNHTKNERVFLIPPEIIRDENITDEKLSFIFDDLKTSNPKEEVILPVKGQYCEKHYKGKQENIIKKFLGIKVFRKRLFPESETFYCKCKNYICKQSCCSTEYNGVVMCYECVHKTMKKESTDNLLITIRDSIKKL